MGDEDDLDLGPDRKVRSISVDSNVILDLYEKYAQDPKSKERAKDSKNLIFLLQVVWTNKIGIKAVETELAREEELLSLYKKLFTPSIKPSKEVVRLAMKYEETGLKSADAAILADATLQQVEFFLSWNRDDIANPNTRKKISEINEGKRKTPFLMKPSFFLDRAKQSEKTGKGLPALMFSPQPVPRRFRVHFLP